MAPRTLVSFEAKFPTEGSPPGRELAECIVEALRSAGHDVTEPGNREDWAWEIQRSAGNAIINSIIGFSDDGPRQWQIHTYLHKPFLQRVFGSKGADQEDLRTYCQAIHAAIKDDPRFHNIRWYDQDVFDKDYGASWSSNP
jgi:hypothetical protein